MKTDEDFDDSLPEKIDLTLEQIERYYIVWAWWRATDKRFSPSQLLREPHEPMSILLEIDNYFERIASQLRRPDDGGTS